MEQRKLEWPPSVMKTNLFTTQVIWVKQTATARGGEILCIRYNFNLQKARGTLEWPRLEDLAFCYSFYLGEVTKQE